MEKYAWKAKLKPGQKDEYVKRHNEIWEDMKDVLKKAGIVNYSIWIVEEDIFGYYECEQGLEYSSKIQTESQVVQKWNEYMKDVMEMVLDEKTGAQPLLEKVFDFN